MDYETAATLAIEANTEMEVESQLVALSDGLYSVQIKLNGLSYTRMKRAMFLAAKYGVAAKFFDGTLKFVPKG